MKELRNWDNNTWLSSSAYINSINLFLLKKKKLNKNSRILDIGCGRGKIFGSLSRKLKLIHKPIGIDPVAHKDVDKSINFINSGVHFLVNKMLIMLLQIIYLMIMKYQNLN